MGSNGNLKWLAGFGLYWAWVVIVFYSDTLLLFSTDPASSLEMLWLWATWAHFVGLLLFAALGARIPKLLTGKTACWVAGVATALGAVAVAGSFPLANEPGGLWLSFAGAFLVGLPSALVLLQWAALYQRSSAADIGIASVVSFAGGLLVYLVARSFPSMVDFSLALILPLASAAILAANAPRAGEASAGTATRAATTQGGDSIWGHRSLVLGLAAIVGAVVVFAVCGEMLRSLSVRVGGAGAQAMGVPYLTGGLVGLVVLALLLLVPDSKGSHGPRSVTLPLLRAIVLVMAFAFLAAPFLEGASISFSYGIFGAGFWCFRAVSWVVCFSGARHLHARATTFVAVLDASFAIAVVGGGELNDFLIATIDNQVLNLTTVSLFTVFLLMVIALVVLNSPAMRYFVQGASGGGGEGASAGASMSQALVTVPAASAATSVSTDADELSALAPEAVVPVQVAAPTQEAAIPAQAPALMPSVEDRLAANVDALSDRYGLTPREREVAHLLARGRNLPFIQKELHISQNTAQTHARHIYRKLGVHSRQEFLDLAEAGKTA